jgi:hypothetical protein
MSLIHSSKALTLDEQQELLEWDAVAAHVPTSGRVVLSAGLYNKLRALASEPAKAHPCGQVLTTERIEEIRLNVSSMFTEKYRWLPFARAVESEVLAKPPSTAPQVDREAIRQELLNTPELHNFTEAVTLEALHQRERWGTKTDAGKTPADWLWLVGFLAGKTLHAQTGGNTDKALHHTISTAAALANWHAAITGAHTGMRPGIEAPPGFSEKAAP